jgi:hypothetical protein
MMRVYWPFLVSLILFTGCDSRSGYSVLEPDLMPAVEPFAAAQSVHLTELLRIHGVGDVSGAPFERITSAVLGIDSSIYIADPKSGQVAKLDNEGRVVRRIGGRGAAQGSLVMPSKVAINGDRIVVFDYAKRSLVSFDTAGTFRAETPLQLTGPLVDMRLSEPFGVALVIAGAPDVALEGRRLSDGGMIRRFARPFARDTSRHLWQNSPGGRVCSIDSTVMFANPFIHELVAYQWNQARAVWAREWKSDELRPQSETQANRTVNRPRSILLGLACSRDYVVEGYLTPSRSVIYDITSASGMPLARVTFEKSDKLAPGFVADLLGDRLLTYRTKPSLELVVYRITRVPTARQQ